MGHKWDLKLQTSKALPLLGSSHPHDFVFPQSVIMFPSMYQVYPQAGSGMCSWTPEEDRCFTDGLLEKWPIQYPCLKISVQKFLFNYKMICDLKTLKCFTAHMPKHSSISSQCQVTSYYRGISSKRSYNNSVFSFKFHITKEQKKVAD